MNIRRGFLPTLKEIDGVVYLHFLKNGIVLYVR